VSTLSYTGIAVQPLSATSKGKYQQEPLCFCHKAVQKPEVQDRSPALRRRKTRLIAVLLCIWLTVRFGPAFFYRTLSFETAGWPVHFWLAAQGAVLVFIAVVVVYALLMNRWEAHEASADDKNALNENTQPSRLRKQAG